MRSSSGPTSAAFAPAASLPAVGAKTSRPWKVGLIGSRRNAGRFDAEDAPRRPGGQRQHAVVGPDEEAAAGLDHDVRLRAPHPGIDHRHMDAAGGKERGRLGQGHRPGGDVLGGNTVGDVHQPRLGGHRQNDPLHGAGIAVARAEIGREGNDTQNAASIARRPRCSPVRAVAAAPRTAPAAAL